MALGLIRLYEVDPSPRWLSAALKTLKYLAETRAGKTDLPADHWALIATRELLKITADQESRPWKALLENMRSMSAVQSSPRRIKQEEK